MGHRRGPLGSAGVAAGVTLALVVVGCAGDPPAATPTRPPATRPIDDEPAVRTVQICDEVSSATDPWLPRGFPLGTVTLHGIRGAERYLVTFQVVAAATTVDGYALGDGVNFDLQGYRSASQDLASFELSWALGDRMVPPGATSMLTVELPDLEGALELMIGWGPDAAYSTWDLERAVRVEHDRPEPRCHEVEVPSDDLPDDRDDHDEREWGDGDDMPRDSRGRRFDPMTGYDGVDDYGDGIPDTVCGRAGTC